MVKPTGTLSARIFLSFCSPSSRHDSLGTCWLHTPMWIPARSYRHAINCLFPVTTFCSWVLWVNLCHKLIPRDTTDMPGTHHGSCRLLKDLTRTKTKKGHSDSELTQWMSLGHWTSRIREPGFLYASWGIK